MTDPEGTKRRFVELQELVLKDHTFDDRADVLLRVVGDLDRVEWRGPKDCPLPVEGWEDEPNDDR